MGVELAHLGRGLNCEKDGKMTIYQTLPVPARIRQLKAELFSTETVWCFERAHLVTASYRETEGQHPALRRARALAKVFDEMSAPFRP